MSSQISIHYRTREQFVCKKTNDIILYDLVHTGSFDSAIVIQVLLNTTALKSFRILLHIQADPWHRLSLHLLSLSLSLRT